MTQLTSIQNKSRLTESYTPESTSGRSTSKFVTSRQSISKKGAIRRAIGRNATQDAVTYQLTSLTYNLLREGSSELVGLSSLLMPSAPPTQDSTGSTLLDSLTKDLTRETPSLRSLDLIAVSDKQQDPQSHPNRIRSKPMSAALNSALFGGAQPSTQAATASQLPSSSDSALTHRDSSATKETAIRDRTRDSAGQKVVRSNRTQSPSNSSAVSTAPAKPAARSVDRGTAARTSAAAVGLLDINDTLLFGGTHGDISAVDPYTTQIDNNEVYTLRYLLQHLAAFTVVQLQNGFPYNADPKVISWPGRPKYQTILDIDSFELKDLDDTDKLAEQESPPMPPSIQTNAELDMDELSAQIRALNAKVEYLSSRLEQVAS